MASHPHQILVVDDEEGIQLTLEDILATEGYEVLIASNGQEALNLLAMTRPAVILLDLMMPVMNGHAFREAQLRLSDGANDIPVVVLSGARDAISRAEALGATAILRKPFDIDDIVRTVRRVIDAHTS